MEKIKAKFSVRQDNAFVAQLRLRMDEYFKRQKNYDKANAAMIAKMVIIGLIFFGSYFLILSRWCSEAQLLGLAVVFGFANALVAFNIAHDAAHYALFKSRNLNSIFAYTFNMIGVNRYIWELKHNKSHHSFTNVPAYDTDIEQVKIARIVDHKPLKWFYRYQHIYLPFLWPFTSVFLLFVKDFQMFATKDYGNYYYEKHPRKEYVILFLSKAIYVTYAIVIPYLVLQLVWWKFLIGFAVMHFVLGLFLAIIFFPAHVLDDTSFPKPDEKGHINNSWMMHQVETTSNFGVNSRFLHWISGGLNTHIAHHLYPQVCHIHYYEMSKIIRQTANEHGIKIIEHNLWEAISSHLRLLKHMGQNEKLITSKTEKRNAENAQLA